MPGLIGGSRHYEGPGLGDGPWKCPACGVENAGPLDQGCVTCGSGSARPRHVGNPPPVAPDLRLAATPIQMTGTAVVAAAWAIEHADATLAEAYLAGYAFGQAQALRKTMQAPPVTVDTRALAPEGKPRRTIIAALELFKDQVLRGASDEIASGEWLTIEETERLIQQLKDEEDEVTP